MPGPETCGWTRQTRVPPPRGTRPCPAQALTRGAPASPPETPQSAACPSWLRRHRAGWAAGSQGRNPSARQGTCGRGVEARRWGSGGGGGGQSRGSPASVHSGEGEGHALEEQEHKEPLAGGTVPHALAVLAGLQGGRGSSGIRPLLPRLSWWARHEKWPARTLDHSLGSGRVSSCLGGLGRGSLRAPAGGWACDSSTKRQHGTPNPRPRAGKGRSLAGSRLETHRFELYLGAVTDPGCGGRGSLPPSCRMFLGTPETGNP